MENQRFNIVFNNNVNDENYNQNYNENFNQNNNENFNQNYNENFNQNYNENFNRNYNENYGADDNVDDNEDYSESYSEDYSDDYNDSDEDFESAQEDGDYGVRARLGYRNRSWREFNIRTGRWSRRRRLNTWMKLMLLVYNVFVILKACILSRVTLFQVIMYRLTKHILHGLPTLADLADHCETSDWRSASIRRIVCNSSNMSLGLITNKDVLVLFREGTKGRPLCVQLPRQSHACCVSFRPFITAMRVAIGGAGGISLWSEGEMDGVNIGRLEYRMGDYIVEVQWAEIGTYLFSASLGNRRIQIWQPDVGQLMQEVDIALPGTTCWAFSSAMDLLHITNILSWSKSVPANKKMFDVWGAEITAGWPLQTASWLWDGSHLLLVPKRSSKVYSTTCSQDYCQLYQQPVKLAWRRTELVDFSSFVLEGQRHDAGQIKSMDVDPNSIYVAFLFDQQPFVLLCMVHLSREQQVCLLPFRLFDNARLAEPALASCLVLGPDFERQSNEEPPQCNLFIAWTNGQLQSVPLHACDPIEVIQLEFVLRDDCYHILVESDESEFDASSHSDSSQRDANQ